METTSVDYHEESGIYLQTKQIPARSDMQIGTRIACPPNTDKNYILVNKLGDVWQAYIFTPVCAYALTKTVMLRLTKAGRTTNPLWVLTKDGTKSVVIVNKDHTPYLIPLLSEQGNLKIGQLPPRNRRDEILKALQSYLDKLMPRSKFKIEISEFDGWHIASHK